VAALVRGFGDEGAADMDPLAEAALMSPDDHDEGWSTQF
jgi:hypothetical protein